MACPETIATPDAASEALLRDLQADGRQRESALSRLHELLVRGARREAARRSAGTVIAGLELADIAEQAADDALVAIIAKLERFRGESRFTTWAYKFVILEVASKITRHAWRTRPTAALDLAGWEQLPDRFSFTPEETLEQRELLDALRVAVEKELTAHQREVFVALVLDGMPLDVLADRLDATRNALYKTLFDARRKVRAHLVANGYMEAS